MPSPTPLTITSRATCVPTQKQLPSRIVPGSSQKITERENETPLPRLIPSLLLHPTSLVPVTFTTFARSFTGGVAQLGLPPPTEARSPGRPLGPPRRQGNRRLSLDRSIVCPAPIGRARHCVSARHFFSFLFGPRNRLHGRGAHGSLTHGCRHPGVAHPPVGAVPSIGASGAAALGAPAPALPAIDPPP